MEYDYVGRPKTVSLDDLTRMQEFIQGERLESLALEDAPLVIGDKVTIMVAPFEGMRGTIQKIRNDSVRLLVGTKYISLNPRFLQKV
jgi:transcription antitermination factor NusG